MSEFNEFDEYYSSLSDRQIIEILQDKADRYQPAALAAAKREFVLRGLDENKIEEVKQELIKERKTSPSFLNFSGKSTQKFEEPEENSANILPPNIDNQKPVIEKILKALDALWTFYTLYFIFCVSDNFIGTINDLVYSPITSLLILAPLAILVLALIKLIRRKPLGWKLLLFYCIYSMPNLSLTIYNHLKVFSRSETLSIYGWGFYYRLGIFSFSLLLIVFTIYSLMRNDCMKIFAITHRMKQVTIAVSVFIALAVVVYFLNIY